MEEMVVFSIRCRLVAVKPSVNGVYNAFQNDDRIILNERAVPTVSHDVSLDISELIRFPFLEVHV